MAGGKEYIKSTLVVQLIQLLKDKGIASDAILYVNKELLEWDFIKSYKELYDHIKGYFNAKHYPKQYIFIDEIQEIADWEKAIASLYSESYADITITGPN